MDPTYETRVAEELGMAQWKTADPHQRQQRRSDGTAGAGVPPPSEFTELKNATGNV